MNSVNISGNLGKAPELSYTPQTQTACCRLSVAVARDKKDEQPDWLRVTVWGRQAETCNQYLVQGQHVEVHGRIRVSKGKDGREYTEIVADKVEFGSKPSNAQTTSENTSVNEQVSFSQADDGMPF